jgi:glycosyltransferase involved in cell wall biosynthesis
VAVEAAACGALPLSAAHSGLAEVTRSFQPAVEPDIARLLSFQLGPGVVREIASKLVEWLELPEDRRGRASAALSELARQRYGWQSVAEGVIAAAQGRLAELPEPSG